MSSKEPVEPQEIPFSLLSSLIFRIGRIKPRRVGQKRERKDDHYPAYNIFKQWVQDLRRDYSPLPAGTTSIIFRVLFPNEDARRKYDIKEKRMTRLLADCFSVKEDAFLVWDSEQGLGCLGLELKEVMEKTHSGSSSDSLFLAEVDTLIDELSCLSGFTDSTIKESVRKTQLKRPRAQIIRSIFRRLSPDDACVVTQVILKDLRPLLYPSAAKDYTSALTKFNSASVKILSKEHAMEIWDPSKLMLKFHRLQSDIDNVAAFADQPEKSEKDIRPQIGQALAIPKSTKGTSVKDVIEKFSKQAHKDPIVWAETKYDGERAQIHIEIRENNKPHITIYSKSKRNSTHDRHGIHHIIREALGFDRQDNPVASGMGVVKRNIVLDAEMVACKGEKIDEFWRIRQLINDTARGVRAGRRRTKAPNPECQESMRSDLNEEFSLGLVFFDILVLDDSPLLWRPYHQRRQILESFIRVQPGKSMLAARYRIDINHPNRTILLKQIFKQHCDDHQEGLVLKSEYSYYNDYKNPWIKLKKDYIDGYGDTLSMAMLGAAWNKDRARELQVPPTTFTTFYIGVLTNRQDLLLNPDEVPKFDLYFAVEYGLTRNKLEEFNTMIKACDSLPYSERDKLPYRLDILDEINPGTPSILLANPIVLELLGAGFSKAPLSKHYELRFPRILKIHRQGDRSWKDAADCDKIRNVAQESVGHSEDDDTPSQWCEKVWAGQVRPKALPSSEPLMMKEQTPADEEEPPRAKRRRIQVPTTPPASSPITQAFSSPFTPRTNTVQSHHQLVPPRTPASSQLSSASRYLTVFTPMRVANSRHFTVKGSQVSASTAQLGRFNSIVWFAAPKGENGCSNWYRYQALIQPERKTGKLINLLAHCGWRVHQDIPQSRRMRYGLIILDVCSERGAALREKTRRLLEDVGEGNKDPLCLPIYIIGCCDDPDTTFCDG